MFFRILAVFVLVFSCFCFAQDATNAQGIAEPALKPSEPHIKKGVLSVESSAPAGVWINEAAFGTTPFSAELPIGWTVYSLRSQGYWTAVALAHVDEGRAAAFNIPLKPHGEIPNAPQIGDLSKIYDLKTLENLYDSLARIKPSALSDSVCIAYFAANAPPPYAAPAPLTANSHEYQHYYRVYNAERQADFNEWISNCAGSVALSQNKILARLEELGKLQVSGYIPVAAGSFKPSTQDGLKGDLELYFRSSDGRVDVKWNGKWENDFLAGDLLVKSLTASAPSALAFLSVWNQAVWIPLANENAASGGSAMAANATGDAGTKALFSRRFYKYSELNISWNGLVFTLKGEFVLPEYIRTQPEVAAWLETPAAKDTAVADSAQSLPIERLALVKVPGGRFKFKEKNAEVKPFKINAFEISQGLYNAKCGKKKDFGRYKGDSLPAHSINWNEANQCCAALGGELPTEQEWEYAARAGNPNKYIWGGNSGPNGTIGTGSYLSSDYAIYKNNIHKGPSKIGTKKT